MGIEEMVLAEREKRGMERGERRGIEHGIEHKKREVTISMIQKKFSDEIIADVVGVSLEYIREVRKTLPN